jgi:hypothetical protein
MSATDLFDLTGKVALVTGGNSGLCLGLARGSTPTRLPKRSCWRAAQVA